MQDNKSPVTFSLGTLQEVEFSRQKARMRERTKERKMTLYLVPVLQAEL